MVQQLIVAGRSVSVSEALACGLGVGVAVWILSNHRFIRNVIRTLPRDFVALYRYLKVVKDLKYYELLNYSFPQAFDETVRRNPNKVLLCFEDEEWTAEQIQKLSNKVANFFQSRGLKKGDTVALFMENCAEYVVIWLGLARIGCVASLVNHNLRLQPLKHCFEAVDCKTIIYGGGLASALEELIDLGGLIDTSLFSLGQSASVKMSEMSKDLMQVLKSVSDDTPICKEPVGFLDPIIYIYTSGTTGLPKAATIKNSRFFMGAIGNFYTHGLAKSDILYTALPLYHGSGTLIGSGPMLIYGVTQVVRKKFSASNFWKDCIKYKCTAAQYIGEICRYLLAQPPSLLDKQHAIRVMYGNGLKSDLWKNFVERFNVGHVSELYGATEGNCNMVNMDGTIGAVGFLPIWLSNILPIKIIRVDEEGQPIRDSRTGLCILCKPNEPGELVGKIKKNHPISDFEGYADENSSKDKVLFNVRQKGDSWFRSGDILMQDELGYFYFKDRKGDTFRWKGENCSTAEVEGVIMNISNLQATVVFGVEIPGSEGRAGMAVVGDPDNSLDVDKLGEGICKNLPAYSRPLFLRICPEVEMTGTYKLRKIDYQKAGFDLHKVKDDKLYFLSGGSKYVPFTQELYDDIMTGKLRL